jgi:hypothetical protein
MVDFALSLLNLILRDTSNYQAISGDLSCSILPSDVAALEVEAKQLRPQIKEFKPLGRQKRIEKSRWTRVFGNNTWTWEIVSCAVCIITIVATFVVLNHYDGHPIPIVLPNDIKLGSLLSIFSTIIKAAISVPLSAGLLKAHNMELYSINTRPPYIFRISISRARLTRVYRASILTASPAAARGLHFRL